MHSTQFTALARSADEMYLVVPAMIQTSPTTAVVITEMPDNLHGNHYPTTRRYTVWEDVEVRNSPCGWTDLDNKEVRWGEPGTQTNDYREAITALCAAAARIATQTS
jgi:hypothetical protein